MPWEVRVAGGFVAGHREEKEKQIEVHALEAGRRRSRRLSSLVMMSSRGSSRRLGRKRIDVHEHLDLGLVHLLLADGVLRILAADHPVAPVEYLVAILERNAQQLGDHLQRKLRRHIDDEVHRRPLSIARSIIAPVISRM